MFFLYQPMLNIRHVTPGMELKKGLGQNWNKLGRGPLDDATYQISRSYALLVQTCLKRLGFQFSTR